MRRGPEDISKANELTFHARESNIQLTQRRVQIPSLVNNKAASAMCYLTHTHNPIHSSIYYVTDLPEFYCCLYETYGCKIHFQVNECAVNPTAIVWVPCVLVFISTVNTSDVHIFFFFSNDCIIMQM